LVERLAEQDRLRFDAADAPAEDAETVDHRRVGIGADERVGEGDRLRAVEAGADDGGEVFQVDLMDDAGARRHDAEVLERLLRPAKEGVPLAVALVLELDVAAE
jgi:hypothetical protein